MSALAQTRPALALAGWLLAAACALAAAPARAAEVPGLDREVEIVAREQPVARFVEELLGRAGVPARVDEGVRGTVNGEFSGTARDVYSGLADSFQLVTYFDGAVAWVYPASAIERDLLYVAGAQARRIVGSVGTLGLADERNRIERSDMGVVVTGTPRFVDQVRELAEAVSRESARRPAAAPVPAAEAVMRVFRLSYAWAGDVYVAVGDEQVLVPGVASLLRELVGPGAVRGISEPRRRAEGNTLDGLRGEGLGDGPDDPAVTAVPAPAAPELERAPDDGSTTDTRIVADTLSNSVVVRDRADRMNDYARLIGALDVEPEAIEIEATIIDLNTDRLRELGINWRVDDEDASALFGDGTAADRELVPGGDIIGRGQGGVLSLVLGDSTRFLARIRALETQGAARVVSKPHVMTLSNVEALLDTSSTFFVRVEGEEEVDLFDVSVGTTLRVTPHVLEGPRGARIKLRVGIEDGSTTDRTVDRIPVIQRSAISTQALVNEGESLLIGGLVRDFSGDGVSKVPVLGDIPVVGALFRNTSRSASRLERLFLISPRVNLRSREGLRYSAPTVLGDEATIVRTAPGRVEPALAGVASRDDDRGLVPTMPPNGADVRLVPEAAPRVGDLPPRLPRGPRESLRERLGLEPDPDAAPVDDAGWQELDPDAPLVPVVPGARVAPVGGDEAAAEAAALELGPPDTDGWQEVLR